MQAKETIGTSGLVDNLSVWMEFGMLAQKYQALLFGAGAPHIQPPKFLTDNLFKKVNEGANQYSPPKGNPALLAAIAKRYGKLLNRELNPGKEVVVSHGANQILNSFYTGLMEEGCDIAFMEPLYPQYLMHANMARANITTVPVVYDKDAEDWKLDFDVLKKTITDKTRVFVFNNPHNPTGKVFNKEEIDQLSEFFKGFPKCTVIADEVYDFLLFDNNKHIYWATVGDNWERSITVFSGGKIYNSTGWRVGWAVGPANLIVKGAIVNAAELLSGNTPCMAAMAESMEQLDEPYEDCANYCEYSSKDFQNSRDIWMEGLKNSALPIVPLKVEAGYFVMCDVSGCKDLIPAKYFESNEYEDDKDTIIPKNNLGMPVPLDLAFCRWIAMEKKVVVMPASLFYYENSPYKTDKYVRIAICMGEVASKKAIEALKN
jgi:aspartate/methionine/tyrosine aminotransferase